MELVRIMVEEKEVRCVGEGGCGGVATLSVVVNLLHDAGCRRCGIVPRRLLDAQCRT